MLRSLATPLLRGLSAPLDSSSAPAPADAIVILGCPLRGDGGLSTALQERVTLGCELWQRGLAPTVVVTGRGLGATPEAAAMATAVLQGGVPEEAVVVEDRSMNTWENAFYCRRLLPQQTRSVIVVSQPFHLRRACLLFRRAGFAARAAPNPNSVQFTRPRRGLRWVVREYGAWLVLGLTDLAKHP